MTDTKSPLSREERLAARLRENLKRRKAQARALGDMMDETGQSEGESLPDSANPLESGLPKTAR
jgi:hypothetical protein